MTPLLGSILTYSEDSEEVWARTQGPVLLTDAWLSPDSCNEIPGFQGIAMITLQWKSPSAVQATYKREDIQQKRMLSLEVDRPGFEFQLGLVLAVEPQTSG